MDDLEILERLKQDRAILERCNDCDTVKEFWKMCQIPDFRQLFPQAHAETIREIFLCWNDHGHAVPHDWIRKKLERLAHFSGDLEQLTARLAGVRIWNYLCNHSNWVSHAEEIVEEIRTTEERLSLSLHESLMQRFVPERSQQRYRRSYPIENTQNENTPSIDWKRVQGSSFNELHDSLQSQLDVHHATLELASKQINPAEFILRLDGDVYFRNNKIGMLVINQRSWNSSVIVHQADQKPDNAQCYKEHLTLWFEEQNAKYRSFMQYPTHDDPERALQYALLEGFGWADEKNLRHACPNALQKRLLKSFRVKRTLLGLIHLDWWKPGALAFRVALLNQRLGLSPLREEELRQALIHTNPERQDWLRALGFVPFGALALRLDLALALPELLMDINHRLSPQDTPSAISQHLSVSLDKLGLSRQDLLKLSQQRDSAIPRVLKKAVSKLLSLLR